MHFSREAGARTDCAPRVVEYIVLTTVASKTRLVSPLLRATALDVFSGLSRKKW